MPSDLWAQQVAQKRRDQEEAARRERLGIPGPPPAPAQTQYAPIPTVGRTPERVAQEDPDQAYLTQRLANLEKEQAGATQKPAGPLRQQDPLTAVVDSINRIGGPDKYSGNFNRFADTWVKYLGVPADSTVMDLARVPTPPENVESVIKGMAQGYGVIRWSNLWDKRSMIGFVSDNIAKGIYWANNAMPWSVAERAQEMEGLRQVEDGWLRLAPYRETALIPEPKVLTAEPGAVPFKDAWQTSGEYTDEKGDTYVYRQPPESVVMEASLWRYNLPDPGWSMLADLRLRRAAEIATAVAERRLPQRPLYGDDPLSYMASAPLGPGLGIVARIACRLLSGGQVAVCRHSGRCG